MAFAQPTHKIETKVVSYKQNPKRTSFLDLPYEIRNAILVQYFYPSTIYLQTPRGTFPRHSRRNVLIILAVNHQLRHEARAVLDKQIIFKARCLGDLMRYTKRGFRGSLNFLEEVKRLEILLFDVHDKAYRRDWRQWDPQSISFATVFSGLRQITLRFSKDAGQKPKPEGTKEPFVREAVRDIFDPCRRNIKRIAHGYGDLVVTLEIEFRHMDLVDTGAVVKNGVAEVVNPDATERDLWKKHLELALKKEDDYSPTIATLGDVLSGHQT